MSECNLFSNDNTEEVLLMQVKREITDLQKTTKAQMLIQDGKIADVCVYIKNNLSNYLRLMLDSLQLNGELDDIITTTIATNIKLLQSQVEYPVDQNELGVVLVHYPYGHVKRYGAVGDGSTNDTKAIQTAAENCIKNGYPLTADTGSYLITSDIDMRYIERIDFQGVITTSASTITIGNRSANGAGSHIYFKSVKNLKVVGLKGSVLNIDYCEYMQLYANGDDSTLSSTAYNQFYGSYCKRIDFETTGTGNIGWINENVFRIKRIEEINMNGEYTMNNNRFEHCNLERGRINLHAARNNYFSARGEGGITVVQDGDSEANFIEKEYYYKHYFGDDIEEYPNGSVAYYLINKLQTERELLKIDQYNKSFPIGSLLFNEDGTFTGIQYNQIYRSNLIPINHIFALKMLASHPNVRVQMNFYDANKNRIYGTVDNFADGKMAFNTAGDWSYGIGANVDNDTVVFYPGTAKFVEYRVIFGTNGVAMDFVKIKLVKMVGTDIIISDTLQHDVYTGIPTAGYWERGHRLYGKNPNAGQYAGIICVESGVPGTWKSFGNIIA